MFFLLLVVIMLFLGVLVVCLVVPDWYYVFQYKYHPYTILMRMFWRVIPGRLKDRRLYALCGGRNLLERMISRELDRQYHYDLGPEERLEVNKAVYWGSQVAVDWHENMEEVYDAGNMENIFLKHRGNLAENIVECHEAERLDLVIEMGSGNGMFIKYLHDRLGTKVQCIGLDLNGFQAEKNNERYGGRGLEYRAQDVIELLENLDADLNIYLVACEVLEHATYEYIHNTLSLLKSKFKRNHIGISEPVNISLKSNILSTPRTQVAYSHNFPKIFELEGFKQRILEVIPLERGRGVLSWLLPSRRYYKRLVMVGE